MVLVTWLAAASTTYRGVALPQKSISDPRADLDMIFLYRRPILDYWCESGEDLRRLVRHVRIHEIGHHFGFSDGDMERIEDSD
jgi:predicted Zn-dependent protease with MMP-like domain